MLATRVEVAEPVIVLAMSVAVATWLLVSVTEKAPTESVPTSESVVVVVSVLATVTAPVTALPLSVTVETSVIVST